MAKEVAGLIKLQIKGGAANPSPPVGPALGSKGTIIIGVILCRKGLPPSVLRRILLRRASGKGYGYQQDDEA